ncbi:hypothetical protein ISCGN_010802 [Ixodes scapularis]
MMSTRTAAERSTKRLLQPWLEEKKETRSDGLKAEIKDGIVYSPYPEIEIPMSSLYAVVEQSLLRFGDKAALVSMRGLLCHLIPLQSAKLLWPTTFVSLEGQSLERKYTYTKKPMFPVERAVFR